MEAKDLRKNKKTPAEPLEIFLPVRPAEANVTVAKMPTPLSPTPLTGQPGSACPRCAEGVLDYDGMLNLTCPLCKYVEGGCFT